MKQTKFDSIDYTVFALLAKTRYCDRPQRYNLDFLQLYTLRFVEALKLCRLKFKTVLKGAKLKYFVTFTNEDNNYSENSENFQTMIPDTKRQELPQNE